jgi:hypothetical protein
LSPDTGTSVASVVDSTRGSGAPVSFLVSLSWLITRSKFFLVKAYQVEKELKLILNNYLRLQSQPPSTTEFWLLVIYTRDAHLDPERLDQQKQRKSHVSKEANEPEHENLHLHGAWRNLRRTHQLDWQP